MNHNEFTCLASNGKLEQGHQCFIGDSWQAKRFAESIAKKFGNGFKPIVRGDGWQWTEE